MTRPFPPDQNLLTRSDLARLQVPAGEVASWLARGWIEPMGTLPGADGDGPVYGVPADDLGRDLAARLAAIGKPDAVLAPTDVRSLLLHAWAQTSATHDDGRASTPGSDGEVTSHLHGTDLAQVLQEAAAEVEAEIDQVLRFAAEEHAYDSPALADDEPRPDDDDPEACFDVDDLAGAIAEPTADQPRPGAPASPQVERTARAPAPAEPAAGAVPTIDARQGPASPPPPEPIACGLEATPSSVHARGPTAAASEIAARMVLPGVAAVDGCGATDDVAPRSAGDPGNGEHRDPEHGLASATLAQLTSALDDVRAQLERQAVVLRSLGHARSVTMPYPPVTPPPAALLAPLVLTGIVLWSVLLWWKADAPQLALSTALGANAAAWWLLSRRMRL